MQIKKVLVLSRIKHKLLVLYARAVFQNTMKANLKKIKDLAKKGNHRSRFSFRSYRNGQIKSPKGIIVKN